ncbi:MAG TPA: FAD-dependent oxidoreductase, partial [Hyphomicrobiales bacterium]|nr:FAD-dependent oxidoreductase [Hyphomicrobiales bacterium]
GKVTGLRYLDRESHVEQHLALAGVFVQIGLVPNSDPLKGVAELSRFGEVLVNGKGETSVPGLYAAGDVTNSAFKQIIISMGSGATAALGAYEYLMLHAQQRQAA